MLSMNLIKNPMSDGSATFDLILMAGDGNVLIPLVTSSERDANIKANRIHEALEAATGGVVSWGDMLEG